jgi:hypothetical protein
MQRQAAPHSNASICIITGTLATLDKRNTRLNLS